VQRGGGRRAEEGGRREVCGGVLAGEEAAVGEGAAVEGDGAAVDGLADEVAELLGLGGVDEGAEVQLREVVGRVGDGERVAEAHGLDAGEVGVRKSAKAERWTTKRG
jgi:hypothetical protein